MVNVTHHSCWTLLAHGRSVFIPYSCSPPPPGPLPTHMHAFSAWLPSIQSSRLDPQYTIGSHFSSLCPGCEMPLLGFPHPPQLDHPHLPELFFFFLFRFSLHVTSTLSLKLAPFISTSRHPRHHRDVPRQWCGGNEGPGDFCVISPHNGDVDGNSKKRP